MMINIYPGYEKSGLKRPGNFFEIVEDLAGTNVIPLASGRCALIAGLKVLGFSRMDEVFVPPYLSHCVLSPIMQTAMPSLGVSSRTKGILVLHQFGFPQDLHEIESAAHKKGWIVINNCAHALYAQAKEKSIVSWGDFSIISFPKFFPCVLGGALVSTRADVVSGIKRLLQETDESDKHRSLAAFETLKKAKTHQLEDEVVEVKKLYGILADITTFPSQVLASLPQTKEDLVRERKRREILWTRVKALLPEQVPQVHGEHIAPFAIPISGPEDLLQKTAAKIKKTLQVETPLLHFDFACNMLKPQYKKSLVIGCHKQWEESLVIQICELIKNEIHSRISHR